MTLIKLFIFLSFLFSSQAHAKQSFDAWKKSYVKKAARRGIPASFTKKIFEKVHFDQKVVEKDRNQVILSKTKNYQEFMKRWLRDDNKRVSEGIKLLNEHDTLLSKIEKQYGVDKEVIVSLWGVETFYGKITGDYNVINSLATLVYDGRRRKFYTAQLNAALRLVYKGHVKFEDFKGSWAGATGQCQFMPSNIPVYGQDYNKDGKVDLWNTKEDVFASIANFLKKVGWKKGKSIGSLALNTKDKDLNFDRYRSYKQYNKLGFRTLAGEKFEKPNWRRRRAAEIPMEDSPIVLRGTNFTPLLKWNRSSLFAAFNIILYNSFIEAQSLRN
jgi:membrane-bound lytic murein transglycosylase B